MIVLPQSGFLRRHTVVRHGYTLRIAVILITLLRLLQLLQLLLFENFPPLPQTLGGAAGNPGGDLLPLVVVLGLQRNHQNLLLRGQRPLLYSRLEVILPPLEAGFRVPIKRPPHSLGDEIPFLRTVLLDICAEEGIFFRLPPLSLLHLFTIFESENTPKSPPWTPHSPLYPQDRFLGQSRRVKYKSKKALKLMKCAVIDCCFSIFEIRVLFGFLILGEENGVRVFPLRPLRGEKSEKHNNSAKLRFMKMRQDSKNMGGVFVDFEDKDFNGSVSVKMPGISVKAANKFVILDSMGNLHMCLSSSLHGLDTGCVIRQSTQTMKVHKMAVFHGVSTVTQTVWISDGCYTVHLMAVSGVNASVDESEREDTDEKLVKISVTQVSLTSEKIHDIVPMDS